MIDLEHEIKRELDRIEPPDLWDRIRADAANDADAALLDLTTVRHRRRPSVWLAVAAVTVLVALVGAFALLDRDETVDTAPVTEVPVVPEPNPTTTDGATDVVADNLPPGSIAFAADAGAGAALTDPVDFGRVETVPEDMDIYVTRAGEPTQRLISSDAHERCPAFSPDGERLAYLSAPGTSPGSSYAVNGPPLDASLVVLRLDGGTDPSDPELVVQFPAAPGYGVRRNTGYPCPQWSPDSSRLAYLAHPDGTAGSTSDMAELRVVTLDGQERVVNVGSPADSESEFAWSPTGDAVAYVRDDGVWTATVNGRSPSLVWQPNGAPIAVSWSSRGELAVTVRTEVPVEGGGSREGSEVDIVDVDTGTATLVDTILLGGSARWSPDGSRLAFVRDDGQIVLADRDDGSTVLLPPPVVDDREISLSDVAWSPTGEHLLTLALASFENNFAGFDSPGVALISLSTDGALVDILTPWTWAFDWVNLRDVSSYPNSDGG